MQLDTLTDPAWHVSEGGWHSSRALSEPRGGGQNARQGGAAAAREVVLQRERVQASGSQGEGGRARARAVRRPRVKLCCSASVYRRVPAPTVSSRGWMRSRSTSCVISAFPLPSDRSRESSCTHVDSMCQGVFQENRSLNVGHWPGTALETCPDFPPVQANRTLRTLGGTSSNIPESLRKMPWNV